MVVLAGGFFSAQLMLILLGGSGMVCIEWHKTRIRWITDAREFPFESGECSERGVKKCNAAS